MGPIILFKRPKQSVTSDEAGTTIVKTILPAAPVCLRAPYEFETTHENAYRVPSLISYTVRVLSAYPEQIYVLGSQRVQYRPSSDDVLRELIPWYSPQDPGFSLKQVDPRLWATIVQIFSGLPDTFRTYHAPLSDQHLPLMQNIPSTSHFSLVTILELPDNPAVTDETILALKQLQTLCALDISGTAVTTNGIENLTRTLVWNDLDDTRVADRRGPWALRILDVRKCNGIDNNIFITVEKFILLTVLGMSHTAINQITEPSATLRRRPRNQVQHLKYRHSRIRTNIQQESVLSCTLVNDIIAIIRNSKVADTVLRRRIYNARQFAQSQSNRTAHHERSNKVAPFDALARLFRRSSFFHFPYRCESTIRKTKPEITTGHSWQLGSVSAQICCQGRDAEARSEQRSLVSAQSGQARYQHEG